MDDLERQLVRSKLKKRLVIGVALLVVFLSPCLFYAYGYWEQTRPSPYATSGDRGPPPEPSGPVGPATAEQRAAVEAGIAAYQAQLDAEVGPWRDAMARGAEAVPTSGRCPFEVPLPRRSVTSSEEIPGGLVGLTREGGRVFFATSRERAFDYHIVEDGQVPDEPAIITRMRGYARPIREAIEREATPEEHDETVEHAERLTDRVPRFDVVIFARQVLRPSLADHEFDPGVIWGNAVVYDYRRDEIACAAEVRARPTSVWIFGALATEHPDFQTALDLVLDDALEREVARNVQFRARIP